MSTSDAGVDEAEVDEVNPYPRLLRLILPCYIHTHTHTHIQRGAEVGEGAEVEAGDLVYFGPLVYFGTP